jgi:hypothetical protein
MYNKNKFDIKKYLKLQELIYNNKPLSNNKIIIIYIKILIYNNKILNIIV